MHFILIAVFLAAVSTAHSLFDDAETVLEKRVNATISCVIGILGEGDESLGLPAFDPLFIERLDIDLDELEWDAISGNIVLENVTWTGITRLNTIHLQFRNPGENQYHVEITWQWPYQTIVGAYHANINALGLDIQGDGHFNAAITNLVIENVVDVTLPQQLDALSVRPNVENVEFDIDGLKINGKDRSRLISRTISNSADFINEHTDDIAAIIETVAKKLINKSEYANRLNVLKELIQRCW